ncbi:AraC family transcriptional regulator [Anaerobium acetethylicum]|uniref:AraC-type DNA-binding protein n=1 Tax=Anaerobium acetethylicum TaxID=1619234 RepID=A0A1D3TVQ4_9FIRM|nr:AraC family transcriptional regulator [Anaerobium acetethylicum]SCP98237.1 AraC-type DNA-binding protein [Anaerobium acetethylicum]
MRDVIHDSFSIDRCRRSSSHVQVCHHFHPCFELYYMQEGECSFFLNDIIMHLTQGEALLIAAMDYHKSTYEKKGFHMRSIVYFKPDNIEPSVLHTISRSGNKFPKSQKFSIHPDCRNSFEDILSRMLTESKIKTETSELLIHFYFQELLLTLFRDSTAVTEDTIPIGSTENAVQAAAQYITRNSHQDLSLEDAARIANLTPTYFSKKFKAITGLGFKEYLNHVRLKEACTLLLETDESISAIASRCGFNNSNYFGDAFKKVFEMSPRDYRKDNL